MASEEEVEEEGYFFNIEEQAYLSLVKEILEYGDERIERTGVGTKALFAKSLTFNLRGGVIPLLTTKRVFWKGVAEELFWFLRGSTDAHQLSEKGVRIWDANATREYLDSRGLTHHPEGDLGKVYGFQWRHWGAEYQGTTADYTGKGIDQVKRVIETIRTNPTDRRMIISAWNVSDLDQMALPPCHLLCQFFVNLKRNELSCQMYQRSCDMGLGVPFNIASYALLTHLIAHVTGLHPGELHLCLGDTHVYLNHVGALRQQLTRVPYSFPLLKIKSDSQDIDTFTFDDLELVGYVCHPPLPMEMAV